MNTAQNYNSVSTTVLHCYQSVYETIVEIYSDDLDTWHQYYCQL